MCGIAGLISSAPLPDNCRDLAKRMAMQLRHRGPDSASYYADKNTLLVHTRLSIIDLEGGQQPIHNEDKTVWVVFNGEIFNYLELRVDLERRGHQFYTLTDTEVIVHLYEEHGQSFVDYLNGQFAIALWDTKQDLALLVRDRVGIAPLYYRVDKDTLWFGSEVKAILAGTEQPAQLNTNALNQIFTYWCTLSPDTVFKGVYEVPPGCILQFKSGRIDVTRYWDLTFPQDGNFDSISEYEAAETIRELLLDACKLRLRADVPVAAYLSGGLDSSIITTLIEKETDTPLQTFSLSFDDKNLDESAYQQDLVSTLKSKHNAIHCDDQDIANHFIQSVWHMEAPTIRTAPIPMGQLSELVHSNDVRVVLTGEGADEVFGGYDIFKEAKIRQFWARQPDSQWRPLLLQKLYPYLQLPKTNAIQYLANFFGQGISNPDDPLFSHAIRINNTSPIKQFLATENVAQLQESPEQQLIDRLPKAFGDWHSFNRAQYIEIKTLMNGYLLSTQGDRMLMKNSVEGRFPFLDHRVIEYANRLHPRLKMKVLNEKHVLKKAAKSDLPSSILRRFKQPYRAPMIPAFFEGRTPEYVEGLLGKSCIEDVGYFDSRKTELLLKKIRAGRANAYKDNMALVAILSTQAWHKLFVKEFTQRISVGNNTEVRICRVS